MKRHVWMVWLAVSGVAAAFATGDAAEVPDDIADNVFLGEQDLAERMEIWRNQYRRMTPGDAPLIQDVGTWPAAWDEFSRAWDAAPAERDLATWLVPVVSERTGSLTVLRDADGNARWSGATDFAKEGAESVTLKGALVSEEDWALWQAARAEIDKRLGLASPPRLRDGEGGGTGGEAPASNMFVSAIACLTNDPPFFRVGLQWTNEVTLDVFAYGPLHTSDTHVVTYTNDENEVITWTNTTWHSVEPGLTGRYDNLWEHVGTVALTNGDEVVFVDTNFLPERSVVRFYAAFAQGDADNDGLNDAFETQILNTSTNSADSDGDGIPDGVEYAASSNPSVSNIWWVTKTTNEYFKVFNRGDCSPPHTPQDVTSQPVVANPPSANSVVADVTITGFVDDAIRVDGNGVDFGPDTQRFNMRHITNEIADLQSGQFTLTLVDYPRPDYSGPNEAKLGWSDTDKFSVEWTWQVPIEMRMEPIWEHPMSPLDNPSGILLGSNGWFQVFIDPPDVVPNNKVVWTSDFNKVSFPSPGRGTNVDANGDVAGDDEVRVILDGAIGDFGLPPFHVRVAPATVVTAKVGVVTKNGEGAVSSNEIMQTIGEANAILSQTGLQIAVETPFVEIPCGAYYWDVNLAENMYPSLLHTIEGFGGLKIYFVNKITGLDGSNIAGGSSVYGIMIADKIATSKGVSLAHEVGHTCGLVDLYPGHEPSSLAATGEIREAWMPDDWGDYGKTNGIGPPLDDFMKRLLMYWQPESRDIPTGEVRGVWRTKENGVETWHLENAPVGLSGMTNAPVHQ